MFEMLSQLLMECDLEMIPIVLVLPPSIIAVAILPDYFHKHKLVSRAYRIEAGMYSSAAQKLILLTQMGKIELT